jgi:hypothetical protein
MHQKIHLVVLHAIVKNSQTWLYQYYEATLIFHLGNHHPLEWTEE